jgi:ferric-dicitrate binding protein FerR (iron transport regulator)
MNRLTSNDRIGGEDHMDAELVDQAIVQSLQGRATKAGEEWLQRWRAVSPANEQHYRKVAAVWSALGELEESPDAQRPNASEISASSSAAPSDERGPADQAGSGWHRSGWRSGPLAEQGRVAK